MSRYLTNTAFAVWLGVATPALADGLSVVIVPPFPTAPTQSLDTSILNDAQLAQFTMTAPLPQDLDTSVAEVVGRQSNISNFGTACGPSMTMNAAIDAMLVVNIFAPCLPYDMIRFEHEGLSFTVPMPMTGELTMLLPALSESADVHAHLSDGTTLSASTDVPDAVNFARVALQWSGADPGELVAKAPKVLDGSVVHLGQSMDADGAVLHVFSSRIDEVTSGGVVRFSMRAPVTSENCAVEHETRVRRRVPGEPVSAYDMTLKGPGCEAVGESLELKNVLQDLKLSRN
ncbi:MAG: hypothetical protein ABJN34_14285 [Litoreibacter sp.]|uniref:hypothetical protein n=1 Tax=Litoreibacter sp. TaxID=1969459 RepID=UPI003298CA17